MRACPICYGRQIDDQAQCGRCQTDLSSLVQLTRQVDEISQQVRQRLVQADYVGAQALLGQLRALQDRPFWQVLSQFLAYKVSQAARSYHAAEYVWVRVSCDT